MEPVRKLRVESLLRKNITEIISKAFGPSTAAVSSVEVSENSKSAVVSLRVFNQTDADDIERYVKIKIGKVVELRNTPKLSFISTKASLDDL